MAEIVAGLIDGFISIACALMFIIPGHMKEKPTLEPFGIARDLYKSSWFISGIIWLVFSFGIFYSVEGFFV